LPLQADAFRFNHRTEKLAKWLAPGLQVHIDPAGLVAVILSAALEAPDP
jgi:hypothetical protein